MGLTGEKAGAFVSFLDVSEAPKQVKDLVTRVLRSEPGLSPTSQADCPFFDHEEYPGTS